jgi:hypothetical protein
MDIDAEPKEFLEQTKKAMLDISSKRGLNRTNLIGSIADMVAMYVWRQRREVTELKASIALCDSNTTTKLIKKIKTLETEAERHDVWKARYQKHFAQQEAEIKELKKTWGLRKYRGMYRTSSTTLSLKLVQFRNCFL